MSWEITLLICIALAWVGSGSKLYWVPIELPVVYEKNLTLFCNTRAGSEATWMKDTDVIVHHGKVFSPLKYSEKSTTLGSYLTIIRLELSDLMASYTCLGDTESFDSRLELNETNFVVIPSTENTEVSFDNNRATIEFERVFPIPTCTLMYMRKPIAREAAKSCSVDGLFYNVNISFAELGHTECSGNITIKCWLGSLNFSVSNEFPLPECKETDESTGPLINPSIYFIVGLCMGLIVISAVVCLAWKKVAKRTYNQGNVPKVSIEDSSQDAFVSLNDREKINHDVSFTTVI